MHWRRTCSEESQRSTELGGEYETSAYLLAWMVLLPAMFLGNDAKLAPELKQKMSDGMVAVIVQYQSVPGKAQLDDLQRRGGKPGVKLTLINAVSAQLPSSAIVPLSNEDAVTYISPDRSVRAHADNAAPAVLAHYAWSLGFDGSGIGIAVIDSGNRLTTMRCTV